MTKQEWQKKIPVIGEVQGTIPTSEKEEQSESKDANTTDNSDASVAVVIDKGKAVLTEDPVCAIQSSETKTPPPQGGLVDENGFTLVVHKKNKVWIGSSSGPQGQRNLSGKLAAGQVNGKSARVAFQPPPPSPPKGRGRGKKRGK
ncbi:unnamed protein product [Linum trigynum]